MKKKKAALGFIFVTILIDVLGVGIIIPILPKLLDEITSAGLGFPVFLDPLISFLKLNDRSNAFWGGLLVMSYAAMQFIFAPIIGNLSDRFGRRSVLLISLLGLTVDYILHAIAPTVAWLFLGRLLAGMAGASYTTANAYIADITPPEKRAQNFGLVGAAFGAGFAIGPVIGGLAGEYSTRLPFVIAAGLSFLNFLYGLIVLPESLAKENRRKFDIKRANPVGTLMHIRKYKVLIGLITAFFLLYLGHHSVHSSWTFYTDFQFEWGAKEIGYSLGLVGILVGIVQGGLIRVIIPRLGNYRTILFGLAFNVIGLVLFSVAFKGWQMIIFLFPYVLGGVAGPAMQGIVSTTVPANEQGEIQGGLTSVMSLTSIIGPFLMNTLVFDYFTTNDNFTFAGAPFALGALISLVSYFTVVRTFKLNKQLHNPTSVSEQSEANL